MIKAIAHYPTPLKAWLATLFIGGPLVILSLSVFNTSMWLFLAVPFAIISLTTIALIGESRYEDPQREQYECLLGFLRDFEGDWTWTDEKKTVRIRERPYQKEVDGGKRYSLRDNVIIDLEKHYSDSDSTYVGDVVRIRVYEPEDKSRETFTDYTPKAGYQAEFKKVIGWLHQARQLKAIVGVALDAEQNQRPLDKARQALQDFRDRTEMRDDRSDRDVDHAVQAMRAL